MKEHVIEFGDGVAVGEDDQESKPLIGNWVEEEALWDCLTCGACVQECPVGVEHVESIVDMRRFLVMEQASMPETAMGALLSMEQRGHPWRGTTYARTDWAEGLDVPTLADHPDADVLFWVGCTAALEQRSQNIARAMASILKRAGVDFAILGNEETCTGDPARRMGNEYLYQVLAQQNIKTMKSYNVKTVVAICPHCFNTIKNEYPHLGGDFDVVHYTEFVNGLIQEGRIRPVAEIKTTISYHDSWLPGSAQRHLRRATRDRQRHTRRRAGRDDALPRERLLLRSWEAAICGSRSPAARGSTTPAPSSSSRLKPKP